MHYLMCRHAWPPRALPVRHVQGAPPKGLCRLAPIKVWMDPPIKVWMDPPITINRA